MVNHAGTIAEAVTRLNQQAESVEAPTPEAEPIEAQQEATIESEDVVTVNDELDADDYEEDAELETSEDDTEAQAPTYKVKVNGEEREVTLEDLRKGYMMEADYRRKTEEVAKHREEISNKYAKLDQTIAEAEAAVQYSVQKLDSEEMRELKELDPQEYYRQKAKVESEVEALQKIKDKRDEDRAAAQREAAQIQAQMLVKSMPEWVDEDVMKSDLSKVSKLWQSMGFTQAELSSINDHRLVLISRKAALYDELMAKSAERKKLTPQAKSVKPTVAKTKTERNHAVKQQSRDKLRNTGNMKDAAAAIKNLL